MKKTGLLLVAATILGAASLTSCGKKFEPNADVVAAIQDAETLTHDQLFKKAAEELGTSGKLKILATTSRGGKDTVKNLFIEELKKHNAAISDPLAYDTTVDGKIYTTLDAEIKSGTRDGYSGTITQDGYQLQTNKVLAGGVCNG